MRDPAPPPACLCGHAAHAGACGALYLTRGGYAPCPCTGGRTGERTTIAPSMRAALRGTLEAAYMPAWTAEARCRSAAVGGAGPNTPGRVWADAFADELSDGNIEDKLPDATAKEFMREACAQCPVRPECLAYAYEVADVHHVALEWIHDEDDPAAAEPVWVYGEQEAGRRFGIYGMVPGRVREQHAAYPDRVARGLAWGATLAAAEGWPLMHGLSGEAAAGV